MNQSLHPVVQLLLVEIALRSGHGEDTLQGGHHDPADGVAQVRTAIVVDHMGIALRNVVQGQVGGYGVLFQLRQVCEVDHAVGAVIPNDGVSGSDAAAQSAYGHGGLRRHGAAGIAGGQGVRRGTPGGDRGKAGGCYRAYAPLMETEVAPLVSQKRMTLSPIPMLVGLAKNDEMVGDWRPRLGMALGRPLHPSGKAPAA